MSRVGNHLTVGVEGQQLGAPFERARVVHQVKVDVINPEVSQRLSEGRLDVFWMVGVAP